MSARPKWALVTGASSGIGAALVARLRADGWGVVAAARRADRLSALEARCGARPLALDVSDPAQVTEVVRALDDELSLSLVVANAGIGGPRWSGALDLATVDAMLDVNVRGAVATLLAAMPAMVARRAGHLVGVTSMAGVRGLPHNAAYGASKAFLRTFLESLRVDLAPHGVCVTEVRPGFVRSEMTDRLDSPKPWMIEADDAAARIAHGVARGDAVVAFPRPMSYLTRAIGWLPSPLFDRAARLVRPPHETPEAEPTGAGPLDTEPPTDPP